MSYTYLASPFTMPSRTAHIENARFKHVRRAAAELLAKGEPVYSPIVFGYAVEDYLSKSNVYVPALKISYATWMNLARQMISGCGRVYVLTIPGWEDSKGLREEVLLARSIGKPIIGYAPWPPCEDVTGAGIFRAMAIEPEVLL